jgi:hypothetical protein
MKKLLLSALMAVAVVVSSFAAETEKVSSATLNNFKFLFKHASDVSWTATKNYSKATFLINNIRTEALYTPDGEFIGTNVAASVEDLPVRAKRTLAKRFDGYTIKEAVRFEGNTEGAYFISAENDKEAVVLKVDDKNDLSMVQSRKK